MGGAEDAALSLHEGDDVLAGVGDVLPEHPDAFVGLHLLEEGEADRLAHADGLRPAGGLARG